MQFLTLSRRRTERFTDAEFGAQMEAEIEQARVLYRDGFIRQIWHRGDVPGGCLLLEADSEEDARLRLNTLPLYRLGMLDVTITPLAPYGGFGPRKSSRQDESAAVRADR
jgi:muconolactone delta-isomerase